MASNFDLRFKHAALELDRLEAVLRDHRPRLSDDAVRVERRSLTSRAPAARRVVARKAEFAASAFIFVEEVGGKRHAITKGAAEQIDDRSPDRLAHQVITGDFDSAADVHPGPLIPRRRAAIVGYRQRFQGAVDGVQMPRIQADETLGCQFEGGAGRLAAGDLAPAGEAVIADDFEDEAQGVGRVQAGRVEQGRVRHGDGGDVDVADLHVNSTNDPASARHPRRRSNRSNRQRASCRYARG